MQQSPNDELLTVSTVFNALSKPATIMGIDYDYFMIVILLIMAVFIYSGNLLAFLLFFPLQLLGWGLAKVDPHIFKLISVRATLGRLPNNRLWGCQSYEAA